MSWLGKLCRDVGLMVHNIRHPGDRRHRVVSKKTEEEQRGNVTLRRTTIEEVEFKAEEKNNV